MGSGRDSTVDTFGRFKDTVPLGFPAACLIALISNSNHASVIRTGTTQITIDVSLSTLASDTACLISFNRTSKDAVSASRWTKSKSQEYRRTLSRILSCSSLGGRGSLRRSAQRDCTGMFGMYCRNNQVRIGIRALSAGPSESKVYRNSSI